MNQKQKSKTKSKDAHVVVMDAAVRVIKVLKPFSHIDRLKIVRVAKAVLGLEEA